MTRILAIIGVAIISFSAIFVRLAEVSPSTAAFFRCVYAVPFLFAVWRCQRGSRRRSASARWLAFAAGIFLGIDLAFWHRAIELIGAGLSTVLGNTQVVFVGLLAWWVYGERPSRTAFVAIPVVFAGVVLISGVIGPSSAYGEDPVTGVIYGLLTGITYAIYLMILRRASRDLGTPAGPLLDATLGAIAGSLVFGLIDGQLELGFTWPHHGWLIALALGSQVVGWLLIAAALPRLPALETSVFLLLQPSLTMVWAYLIFGEALSLVQGVGMALVLTGVGWLSVRGSVDNKARPIPAPPAAAAARTLLAPEEGAGRRGVRSLEK